MTPKESRVFRYVVNLIVLCQVLGQTFLSPHNMVGWGCCVVSLFCACGIHRLWRRMYESKP